MAAVPTSRIRASTGSEDQASGRPERTGPSGAQSSGAQSGDAHSGDAHSGDATAEASIPPVVAVVVTCDPGWWLEECLASLAEQDYPALSVLVVDADSVEDPTPRVAAVMPGAFVRRVRRRRGFGAAANEVLGVVEGASHFVFCHDDVVLGPGAVRHLVEEAFRSNAGVVAPKLVGWFEPDRLLAAGMGADRFGVPVALVERGELDQEQHDAVRDVFFAPASCSLVRADLFASLGGFDATYGSVGEDLDLSWRAHLAGARVVFAPGAKVRHLEVTESGQRALQGELRAVGPDAANRAAATGFGAAVFPEDEEAALAPASLGAAVPELEGTEVAEQGRDASEPAWDLSRWDEEEAAEQADAAAAAAARHAGHHASWRARRDAERVTAADSWSGDDDEWDTDSSASRRRSRKLSAARSRQADRAALSGRTGFRRGDSRPAVADRPRGPDADALDDRRAEARLRAVATNVTAARLVVRLPTLLALTLLESVVRLARRGPAEAQRALRPWLALMRQSGAIRARRRVLRPARAVPDRTATALQVTGTSRLRHALRSAATRDTSGELAAGVGWDRGRRIAVAVWVGAFAVIALGSRRLIGGHLPTVGVLAPWPGLATMFRHATSGWQPGGLGSAGPAPAALGLLALAGTVLLGHTTVLQHVLTVGMIPLGAVGAARLARVLPSRRAPLVALVAYLANPLPYDALVRGRWDGLLAYGALPWVLALLLASTAVEPFTGLRGTGDDGGTRENGGTGSYGEPGRYRGTGNYEGNGAYGGVVADGARSSSGDRRPARPPLGVLPRVVAVGLVTALVAAVAPSFVVVVAVVGGALAVGLGLGGSGTRGVRAAATAFVGSVLAAILLAPWSLGWGDRVTFAGVAGGAAHASHLATLLRFQTGPIGAGPLGYALLIAALLPLVIGRGWRHSWAVAMWTVALASWGLAWGGQHHALGLPWPPVDVALAPAAIALAAAVALGMTAFDLDLSGYTFGWRQVVSGAAAFAAVLSCLPVLGAAGDGRWHQRRAGFDAVLSWMQDKRADGDFRVLWVGSPDVLPVAGRSLDPTLAYATTRNGPPTMLDEWTPVERGPTPLLRRAVTLARRGQTTDLGHLLAPMGVRYIAVVESPGPLDEAPSQRRPIPPDLHGGLESQLDLRRVDRSVALTVYENDAWAPLRIRLPDGATAAAQSNDWTTANRASLHGATPVLPGGHGPGSFDGPLPAGADIEVAEAPSAHWRLSVDGHRAPRQAAFGSANLFTTATSGQGSLRYATPLGWHLTQAAEGLAWVAAVGVVIVARRRPRRRRAEAA